MYQLSLTALFACILLNLLHMGGFGWFLRRQAGGKPSGLEQFSFLTDLLQSDHSPGAYTEKRARGGGRYALHYPRFRQHDAGLG